MHEPSEKAISRLRDADEALRRQLRALEEEAERNRKFDRLVNDLSTSLANPRHEAIEGMVDATLKAIGECIEADRSYLFEFSDDLSIMDNTHEWCREGVSTEMAALQAIPTAGYPWWMEKILGNDIINITDIADLPDAANEEKAILEAQDIGSILVIPLLFGGIPFGFIGFDAVQRSLAWPEKAVPILRFAGSIIANALHRKRSEEILHAELDLALRLNTRASPGETLRDCLKTAMEIGGMDCGGIYLFDEATGTLQLKHHEGFAEAFATACKAHAPGSPLCMIAREGIPVHTNGTALPCSKNSHRFGQGLRALALLPIRHEEKSAGLLLLASHTLEHIPALARKGLEGVAAHLGTAITKMGSEEDAAAARVNLQHLFDTIDDCVFIIDLEGRIVDLNAAVQRRLGYRPQEAIGRTILAFHPEARRHDALANLEAMMAGEKETCAVPIITASGKQLPVETKACRGMWNNQPVLFAISRDISERYRNELLLLESEKRFRELSELLPLPLFELDAQGRLTYGNQAARAAYGYSNGSMPGSLTAYGLCVPGDRALLRRYLEESLREANGTKRLEYTAQRLDGTSFPAVAYGAAIVRDGQPLGYRIITVDMTETHMAEKVIMDIEVQKRLVDEFRSLVDNIPGALYRMNEQGRITILSMTREFRDEFSKEDFEADLFTTRSIIHPEDRERVRRAERELRAERCSRHLSYRIVSKTGKTFWVEDRKTSTFTPEGGFTGIDGILLDSTDKVMIQEENAVLEARLRNTQRLETIGTLAGGIAHDFNNILTPLLGYAELGSITTPKSDPLHDYFDEIVLAAERAKHLIGQILTFSRSQETEPTVVDLQAIIDEALKLLRPSIPSTITIRLLSDGSPKNTLADPSQMHQVVINLCTNAFQAMEASGGILTIGLEAIEPDAPLRKAFPNLTGKRYLRLMVADSGQGMDEATKQRIFEPFFTTKSVQKGTGLGLSVVHGIVTGWNGAISVKSQAGNGTVFLVYLPAIDQPIAIKKTEPLKTGGKARILFVDDEESTIGMMGVMIRALGLELTAFSSPANALQWARSHPDAFNLLITDLTMPEMTGIDLARELQGERPGLPVILMTGYARELEPRIGMNQGESMRFLNKPVRITQLSAAINESIPGTKSHNP